MTRFLWFQENYFQSNFGSYVKEDTMQSLEVYLKVAVSASELEQHYSLPCSCSCFTKKYYLKHGRTMLRAITRRSSNRMAHLCKRCPAWQDRAPWPSPAGAVVGPATAERPTRARMGLCRHQHPGRASTRKKTGATPLNEEE